MNAQTSPLKADDILTFLPGISDEEYEVRAKLRSLRNAAAAVITGANTNAARTLAWLASDCLTEILYAPADLEVLRNVRQYCVRLLVTASQAEALYCAEPSA